MKPGGGMPVERLRGGGRRGRQEGVDVTERGVKVGHDEAPDTLGLHKEAIIVSDARATTGADEDQPVKITSAAVFVQGGGSRVQGAGSKKRTVRRGRRCPSRSAAASPAQTRRRVRAPIHGAP